MTVSFYLLIGLAAISQIGVGRFVLRSAEPGRNFLIGLVFTSAIVTPIAWITAALVVPSIWLIQAAGLAYLVWSLRLFPGRQVLIKRITDTEFWRVTLQFAVALLITGLALIKIHYLYFDFGGELMVYFGPIFELSLAEYFGPIRVSSYYPAEMAGSSLASVMPILVLGSLIKPLTAIHAVQIVYLITTVALARILFVIWRHSALTVWVPPVLLVMGIFIFLPEVEWSFEGSSFIYSILIMEIVLIGYLPRNFDQPEINELAALLIICSMVILKFTIAYVPAFIGLYYIAKFPHLRFRWQSISIYSLVLINIGVVFTVPLPFPGIDVGFSLANPLNAHKSFFYNAYFPDALINRETLFPYLKYAEVTGIGLIFVFGVIKYYALPIAASNKLTLRSGSPLSSEAGSKAIRKGLELFFLISMIGWIFVRNSENHFIHQSALFALAGVAAMVLILIVVTQDAFPRWRYAFVAAFAIYATVNSSIRSEFVHQLGAGRGSNYAGISRDRFNALPAEKALQRIGAESPANVGKRAIMKGVRIPIEQSHPSYSGKLAPYILPSDAQR